MSAESTREKRRRGPKQGVTGSSWRALRPRRSASLRSRGQGSPKARRLDFFPETCGVNEEEKTGGQDARQWKLTPTCVER